ncbi:MAG: hypothetical protein IV090_23110 [Candidatus Sericytochromatia bacterium]|nr:hypothetical protein [Candidatus Sericytochromatia bacterium]
MSDAKTFVVIPFKWQLEIVRIGTFNLIAWLCWIPFGALKSFTIQCNVAGHAYDPNTLLVPLLGFSWWVLGYVDAWWFKLHFRGRDSPAAWIKTRSHSISVSTLLCCLGLLALPEASSWYFVLAILTTLAFWFNKKNKLSRFSRLRKRLLVCYVLYFLFLFVSLVMAIPNFIGAVDCVTSGDVNRNMHSFQTALESYSYGTGTKCPSKWQDIQKNLNWKELINPFSPEEASVINHPTHPESGWPPYIDILGIRFYFHRRNAGAVSYAYSSQSECKIYGFDGNGQLLRRFGQIFFLNTTSSTSE